MGPLFRQLPNPFNGVAMFIWTVLLYIEIHQFCVQYLFRYTLVVR
jgi:hypothetical protein